MYVKAVKELSVLFEDTDDIEPAEWFSK